MRGVDPTRVDPAGSSFVRGEVDGCVQHGSRRDSMYNAVSTPLRLVARLHTLPTVRSGRRGKRRAERDHRRIMP
jgi:hypothetical protein